MCAKAWPEDALEMVAQKFLEDVEMQETERTSVVVICKHFHESTRHTSERQAQHHTHTTEQAVWLSSRPLQSCAPSLLCRFLAKLGRHNYVTPTSYLELISSFKRLLSMKREEIMKMKKRYLVGLDKLASAASQVDGVWGAVVGV